MPDKDLQDLVRRRLWELARTAGEASRLARWVLPPETIAHMARRGARSFISEGLAEFLARALDVPENRVRRAAGLPEVDDPRASVTTRPHLRLIRRSDEVPTGAERRPRAGGPHGPGTTERPPPGGGSR